MMIETVTPLKTLGNFANTQQKPAFRPTALAHHIHQPSSLFHTFASCSYKSKFSHRRGRSPKCGEIVSQSSSSAISGSCCLRHFHRTRSCPTGSQQIHLTCSPCDQPCVLYEHELAIHGTPTTDTNIPGTSHKQLSMALLYKDWKFIYATQNDVDAQLLGIACGDWARPDFKLPASPHRKCLAGIRSCSLHGCDFHRRGHVAGEPMHATNHHDARGATWKVWSPR